MVPGVIVCGVAFAGMQFVVSNFFGPYLTDILGSLARSAVWWCCCVFGSPHRVEKRIGQSSRIKLANPSIPEPGCARRGCRGSY